MLIQLRLVQKRVTGVQKISFGICKREGLKVTVLEKKVSSPSVTVHPLPSCNSEPFILVSNYWIVWKEYSTWATGGNARGLLRSWSCNFTHIWPQSWQRMFPTVLPKLKYSLLSGTSPRQQLQHSTTTATLVAPHVCKKKAKWTE